jgi:hypothetical protein
MKNLKKESQQTTIFEYLKKAEELSRQMGNPLNGSLDVDAEIRAATSFDLKHAKDSSGHELSRYQVAARMSELTGQEITKSMLDNWSAESHEKHRFPCQFLPAFILATGGRRVFDVLSRRSGLFALPGPEALRAEIQRLDEEINRKKEEKKKRILFLKELDSPIKSGNDK